MGENGHNVGKSGQSVGESGHNVGKSGQSVGESGHNVGESGQSVGERGQSVGLSGQSVGESGQNAGAPQAAQCLRLHGFEPPACPKGCSCCGRQVLSELHAGHVENVPTSQGPELHTTRALGSMQEKLRWPLPLGDQDDRE